MTRYRQSNSSDSNNYAYNLDEIAQYLWLKRVFLAAYRLLDLTSNIRATQLAVSRIPGGWPLFAAFVFIGAMDIFAWGVLYFVDFLPSLTYGAWFAQTIGATGTVLAIIAYAFALVPTGSEILGPMFGASVWFMNRITEISIVFDAITDEPAISAMVDASVQGSVFINPALTPFVIIVIKFVVLVLASLVVQHVAICMLVAQVEIAKRALGGVTNRTLGRFGIGGYDAA